MSFFNNNYIITSESVSSGHPDKIADQISDAILDHFLSQDPLSRTAIETLVTSNNVIIAGEVYAPKFNTEQIENIARNIIKEIGYEEEHFHWQTVKITTLIHEQSYDIALGISASNAKDEGAGDQGIMYGYATDETPAFMPAPIYYAHTILKNIKHAVQNQQLPKLGPDAKTQVTLEYENNIPIRATNIVLSIQHPANLTQNQIKDMLYPHVVASLPKNWMCPDSQFLVNPTGRFVIGGPVSDCGLTGRKIMVDTYGGHIPHGGGAFSGKDSTKVDRSAAYMARYIAKNIVAAKLAKRCLVQLSYAIGVSQPLSFYINTFGTSIVSEANLLKFLKESLDLSPRGIREYLSLSQPIYKPTASYGHFGRTPTQSGYFSWETEGLSLSLQQEFKNIYAL